MGISAASLRYAKEVCDAVVAKCLTGRPKTVEKSQAVFILWVELEVVDVFLVHFFFNYNIVIATFHHFLEKKTKKGKKAETYTKRKMMRIVGFDCFVLFSGMHLLALTLTPVVK